eukprot:TRINITY_DN3273_c0_g1_i1.p1 TRINITY_DN3273_c0_g1~~TRINITY_DN3273_c0_g1_i1.p1  ORF type:complete len:265 (-),score=57.57 TRINITY_DN3273_c0_g1_i1:20-814(-)
MKLTQFFFLIWKMFRYTKSPFAWFSRIFNTWPDITKNRPDLFFTVQGQEFKVPFSEFIFHSESKNISDWRECVAQDTEIPDLFLLGDVFFRNVVVMHNLTDSSKPTISLAAQKPGYLNGSVSQTQFELKRHKVQDHTRASSGQNGRFHVLSMEEKVELQNMDQLQYTIPVSIGTPRQDFRVVVDTGSSTFAVFVDESVLTAFPWWFWLSVFALLGMAGGIWIVNRVKQRQRERETEAYGVVGMVSVNGLFEEEVEGGTRVIPPR